MPISPQGRCRLRRVHQLLDEHGNWWLDRSCAGGEVPPLSDNLYTTQFSCLGDWERVMEEGPQTFRGNAIMLGTYDGFTKPSTIKLDLLEIWIYIRDLSDGYAPLLKILGRERGRIHLHKTCFSRLRGQTLLG